MNKSAIAASLAALFFAVACDTEPKKKHDPVTNPDGGDQKPQPDPQPKPKPKPKPKPPVTGVTTGQDDTEQNKPSARKMEEEEAQKAHDRQLEEIIQDEKARWAKALKDKFKKISRKQLEELYGEIAAREPGMLIESSIEAVIKKLNQIIHQPKELETSALENAQEILDEVEKATEEVAASQGANDAEKTKRAANALENTLITVWAFFETFVKN